MARHGREDQVCKHTRISPVKQRMEFKGRVLKVPPLVMPERFFSVGEDFTSLPVGFLAYIYIYIYK